MSIHEQTARMAPRPTTPTDKRRAELASTLRLVAHSEILLGKPELSLPIVRRDLLELADRIEAPTDAERMIAQQFAEHGLTCTTVEEAAQAIEDLSALARTEAAAKAGALVERDALRGLIREVARQSYHVGFPPTREWTAPSTATYSVHVPQDLWDRLVAAARTTEGQ